MRTQILILLFMISLSATAQKGIAKTVKKTFNRTTTISQYINAEPTVIWSLLTNASDFSRWNSTIISIEGDISKGEKIKLKSTLDEKRTFKLRIKELEPNERMVWGGAMGNRTYSLKKEGNRILFSMTEKIGGLMFPLFANKIPSFDNSFEQFTADLKKEAESK